MESIQTPNKYDKLVLKPSNKKGTFDSHLIDCPFPFSHDGKFWMTYVGWNSEGYQTGLASSDDLLNWKKEGMILGCGEKGSINEYNAAMTSILRDNELFGPGTLKRVNNRFVGTYHAYPKPGYEAGSAVIGICYSDDLLSWEICPPVLLPESSCSWEAGGLYKSWLMEADGIYYLFYNAKDHGDKSKQWIEQTGFATSTDLVNWKRNPDNPVLKVGTSGSFDERFASDPVVLRHQDKWLMFYFGLSLDGHARDGVAYSDDLMHWHKSDKILVDVGVEGSIDSMHAHKPGIIAKDGKLYHFYCAAAPAVDEKQGEIEYNQVRGIALATS